MTQDQLAIFSAIRVFTRLLDKEIRYHPTSRRIAYYKGRVARMTAKLETSMGNLAWSNLQTAIAVV